MQVVVDVEVFEVLVDVQVVMDVLVWILVQVVVLMVISYCIGGCFGFLFVQVGCIYVDVELVEVGFWQMVGDVQVLVFYVV